MAELGIAASVLQIAGATWKLCDHTYIIIQGIRKAPDHIQRIADELQGFHPVLKTLHSALDASSHGHLDGGFMPSSMADNVQDLLQSCMEVFKEIQHVVQPFLTEDGVSRRSTWMALTWDRYRKDEVAMLQKTLGSYKLTLNVACSSFMILNESRTHEMMDDLHKDVLSLRRYVEARDKKTSFSATAPSEEKEEEMRRISAYNIPLQRFLERTDSIISTSTRSSRSVDLADLTAEMGLKDGVPTTRSIQGSVSRAAVKQNVRKTLPENLSDDVQPPVVLPTIKTRAPSVKSTKSVTLKHSDSESDKRPRLQLLIPGESSSTQDKRNSLHRSPAVRRSPRSPISPKAGRSPSSASQCSQSPFSTSSQHSNEKEGTPSNSQHLHSSTKRDQLLAPHTAIGRRSSRSPSPESATSSDLRTDHKNTTSPAHLAPHAMTCHSCGNQSAAGWEGLALPEQTEPQPLSSLEQSRPSTPVFFCDTCLSCRSCRCSIGASKSGSWDGVYCRPGENATKSTTEGVYCSSCYSHVVGPAKINAEAVDATETFKASKYFA